MGARISSYNHTIVVQKNKRETCPLLSNRDNPRKSDMGCAASGVHSYKRLNQAQGIADEDWSFASSLLMRHLDHLANRPIEMGNGIFISGCRTQRTCHWQSHPRRHRQIIRALGDRAPAEKDIPAFIKKEQMRCFTWGLEKGWPTPEKNLRCAAPTSPQCRSSGSPSGTHQKTLMSGYLKPFSQVQPGLLVQNCKP